MATYSQISYGSKGSDVTELQKLLNQNGYSLSTDGIFGQKTQQAVKDYQEKNNLTVDGIVGTNTWAALTGGTNATTSTGSTNATTSTGGSTTQAGAAVTDTGTDSGFSYDDYQESDTVQQAYSLLQQYLDNKPGEYTSQWTDQINSTIDQILNREEFSYDLNSDALYQQYKDQYTQLGKLAMMDTMGQAAAMTGGYGNSYAQSAGQQAYQSYLQQLSDVIPELYSMALDQYNQEGEDLVNQYSVLADQDDRDYSIYRDGVDDYYTDLEWAYNQYNDEREFDYSAWSDDREFAYEQYSDDRAYDYQEERDEVADEQWQKEYDESVRQFNEQYGIDESSGSSGSSSGSSSSSSGGSSSGGKSSKSSGGSSYNNAGYDSSVVKQAQAFVGASADGKWGTNSAEAAKKKGYNSLAEVVEAMGGSSGSGNDSNNSSVPTNYSELCTYLDAAVAAGSTKSEISGDIHYASNAGIITQNQAQQLLRIYNQKGVTY